MKKIWIFGRKRIRLSSRHLKRYRQLAVILIRHGFGDFIRRIRLNQVIHFGRRVITGLRPLSWEPYTI